MSHVFPPLWVVNFLCAEKNSFVYFTLMMQSKQAVDLDKMCVPLLDTLGPQGRMTSCGLAIPGQWLALDHKLQEITTNAHSLGMKVNGEKTKLLVFNSCSTKQAVPLVSASPGNTLLCTGTMRLLGLVFDEKLTFWPLIEDLSNRARRKVWCLLRLREAGANIEVLKVNYCSKIRSILEYGAPVWGGLISGVQSRTLRGHSTSGSSSDTWG